MIFFKVFLTDSLDFAQAPRYFSHLRKVKGNAPDDSPTGSVFMQMLKLFTRLAKLAAVEVSAYDN